VSYEFYARWLVCSENICTRDFVIFTA